MKNRLQKIEKAINSMSDDKFNELLNELGVKEEKQWVPERGEWYWSVMGTGTACHILWENRSFDNFRLLMNNVFKTKEEAGVQRDFNIEKAKLIKEIEDSSDVIDWEDSEQGKYYLFYDHCRKEIGISTYLMCEAEGTTYTTNEVFLEKLIANEPERIKKYLFGIGG
jgi:hypothetical protein